MSLTKKRVVELTRECPSRKRHSWNVVVGPAELSHGDGYMEVPVGQIGSGMVKSSAITRTYSPPFRVDKEHAPG